MPATEDSKRAPTDRWPAVLGPPRSLTGSAAAQRSVGRRARVPTHVPAGARAPQRPRARARSALCAGGPATTLIWLSAARARTRTRSAH